MHMYNMHTHGQFTCTTPPKGKDATHHTSQGKGLVTPLGLCCVLSLGRCVRDVPSLGRCVRDVPSLVTAFTCGLNMKTPSAGVIQLLTYHCQVNISELQPHLLHVTSLTLCNVNVDLIQLSEAIPHMTCLKKLDISCKELHERDPNSNGFVQTLQQLSHSNVTTLDITNTSLLGYSAFAEYYSALKQLICPSSGKLEELSITIAELSTIDPSLHERLASLVCGPSSLKSLGLLYDDSSPLHHLINNTSLLKLKLFFAKLASETFSEQVPHIVQILERNKTLQHLELDNYIQNIEDMRTINSALPENNTLQKIVVDFTDHLALSLDPRIRMIYQV